MLVSTYPHWPYEFTSKLRNTTKKNFNGSLVLPICLLWFSSNITAKFELLPFYHDKSELLKQTNLQIRNLCLSLLPILHHKNENNNNVQQAMCTALRYNPNCSLRINDNTDWSLLNVSISIPNNHEVSLEHFIFKKMHFELRLLPNFCHLVSLWNQITVLDVHVITYLLRFFTPPGA